jgi:hypothetical protein
MGRIRIVLGRKLSGDITVDTPSIRLESVPFGISSGLHPGGLKYLETDPNNLRVFASRAGILTEFGCVDAVILSYGLLYEDCELLIALVERFL